jgi:signal transduction histidine kinase
MDADGHVLQLRHDLRSALSIIYGFANLLERRDDDAMRLEAAARIQQAASFLEKVVVSLLDELEVTLAESPYDP